MSSFYRSDVSHSTRYSKGRAGSATSAVGRLTDAKEVAQLSAVIGNRAHDSALQINGHVADKINNVNFKYLVISCHCNFVKAVARAGLAPPLPATVPVQPRLPAPTQHAGHSNTVDRAEISSLLKAKRNITVFSKVTGQPETLCVIFPPRVDDNFISLKIINRLGLEIHHHTTTVSSITWDLKRFNSTGGFVDLSVPMSGSAKSVARRFHIVKDCPFDMLLGTSATNPLRH